MELILIACCKEKSRMGIPAYEDTPTKKLLSKETYQSLLRLRSIIGNMLQLPPGPDFGNPRITDQILYLPAYERYTGRVYYRANFKVLYPKCQDKKVLIISALYGAIDASDSIRYYDAVMDKTRINGALLATWWKQHELGKIVEEYILAFKPLKIHDLLSETYRKALLPWPPKSFEETGISYLPSTYPGEGTGSLWHRGDDLLQLLNE
jgi:hypothetical protein